MLFRRLAVVALAVLLVAGCAQQKPPLQVSLPTGGPGAITVIGINDVYRINGVDGGEKPTVGVDDCWASDGDRGSRQERRSGRGGVLMPLLQRAASALLHPLARPAVVGAPGP